MRRFSLPIALFHVLVACGAKAPAPRWIPLARGFEPAPIEGVARAWNAAGFAARVGADGRDLFFSTPLAADAWQPTGREGEWWAACPLVGAHAELHLGGQAVREVHALEIQGPELVLGRGVFYVLGGRVILRLPAGEVPPADGRLDARLPRGTSANGVFRAVLRGLAGDGLAIWPGERAEIRCELPSDAVLRFRTAASGLGAGERVTFRVRRDDRLLFEAEQVVAEAGPGVARSVALGPDGPARLVFEVEGPPALTAFFDPVVGPREVGSYARRPWGEARPSAILFLADTLRADALAMGGGEPALAPNLNRLAARSLRFSAARSPSTWTLPAHASLFTGLAPGQHGAVNESHACPEAPVTLAEAFAAQGYRTGAVTDSGFVSREYGLDQGFGWFRERRLEDHRLRETLADARDFLAQDDGRPVLLFVHTYRVHRPYRTGPEEDGAAMERLAQRAQRLKSRQGAAALESLAPRYRALYDEAVTALDAELGPWIAELEGQGLLARGVLAFTSDHGEAFLEHGTLWHGGVPHEEQIRIPLFFAGLGLSARESSLAAGLEDLPRTLAELCGVAPEPGWAGRSLLQLDDERLQFAHTEYGAVSALAVIEGSKKLLAEPEQLRAGRLRAAYDLALDPLERVNLGKGPDPWPADLARRAAPLFEAQAVPLFSNEAATPDEAQRGALRALGYGE